ncbi:cation:proton antiporter [Natronolimnobius sp. AArcel1]|uniref:cation:proton antiporter n=1 Tax=Natronolimnobius sp. AArcel1 TaxID=1679093 RepID=UPI0013EC7D2F|nr:cation:proton antiporter [Natronolimnobius sp. AArcel1]NGM67509.1 cation:proton antiporter [Natronolimnobius sp. AArcel1]
MVSGWPVDDPILVFGIAIVVFLTAPLVIRRVRLPGIIGIIVVGAAIGPNGLGVLERDATIILLGEVGIVYLLFVAGLEINLSQFIRYTDRSIVFGVLSFLVPQTVGMVVGYSVLGLSLGAASLFAAIFASHTLLAYPVVAQLGIATRESVTATIGGTIITDTLALLVLAVVIAAEQGTLGPTFWLELSVGLALFFGGVWVIVPRLGRWFFRTVERESYVEFLFVMAVLFGCAYLAELARVEPIIGAFLAGLALNRLIPESGPLMNRIEFVGNALFIPFFLLSVGMLVDVRVLAAGLETVVLTVTLLVLVITTKYAAAWLTARKFGYSHAETMTMFGLSVGQAAAALAIVLIGFDAGLLSEAMLNAVVLMILVVSVLSPIVVDRYGSVLARRSDRTAYDPRTVPQRVAVPFASTLPTVERDRLLECGLLVRDQREEQPLILLSVAQPGEETTTELAAIEEAFEDAAGVAAGAEVPIERETRIAERPASGIVRAAYENRATTLLLGWDGASPPRGRQVSTTIDDVLARTTQQVLVTTLRQPLNTTTKIAVILPPAINRTDGFYDTIRMLEHLAVGVGASIHAVAVGHEPDRYEQLFDLIEPATSVTVDAVDGWRALEAWLHSLEATTLVVGVCPRSGAAGWHPELRDVPLRLVQHAPGSVMLVYPPSSDREDNRQFLQFG